jgi:hypothetical protein
MGIRDLDWAVYQIGRKKVIGGKTYRVGDRTLPRQQALAHAKKFRNSGWGCRVVKGKRGYHLAIRRRSK